MRVGDYDGDLFCNKDGCYVWRGDDKGNGKWILTSGALKVKARFMKAGTCTQIEVVGGLGVIGGAGLFVFGTAEDLTVVGFLPGLITQASGGLLSLVGGVAMAVGAIGKDLGVCE